MILLNFIKKILYLGVNRKDPRVDDALKTINAIAFGAIIINIYYMVLFSFYQFQYSGKFYYNIIANAVFISSLLFVFYHTKRQNNLKAAYLVWVLGHFMTTGIAILFFGHETGSHYYIIAFFPLSILIFSSTKDYKHGILVNAVNLAAYLYCQYILKDPVVYILNENIDIISQNITNNILTIALIIILMFTFLYNLNKARDALSREHDRANNLLLNILPSPIAQRLMQNEENIADGYSEASVLFSDMVNFTQLAETIPPRELVRLLNTIFSEYDSLTEKYEIEKIKTIGDSYMVASGVPRFSPDHAKKIVDFALDMIDVTEKISRETGYNFSIRIGINSGTVIAGVIGTRKFIYDLWGDTVNVASRMESSGLQGKIQITESTCRLLGDDYLCESRGEVSIKGKGDIKTYIVTGKKTSSLSGV